MQVGTVALSSAKEDTEEESFAILMRERYEQLTPSERRVLEISCAGFNAAQIAEMLDVSVETTRTHSRRILGKLQLNKMTAAVAYAIAYGGIKPSIRSILNSSEKW